MLLRVKLDANCEWTTELGGANPWEGRGGVWRPEVSTVSKKMWWSPKPEDMGSAKRGRHFTLEETEAHTDGLHDVKGLVCQIWGLPLALEQRELRKGLAVRWWELTCRTWGGGVTCSSWQQKTKV